MPRPFELPDPNDRSVNEPTAIMSSRQVLGLYNQENPDDKKERVVDSVKEWLERHAAQAGWATTEFSGSQAILTANITVGRGSE